ncbi:MAG: hypothetical protein NXI31_15705 [bacterium]|nr:hypothetical protein [bacterium]
MNPSPVDYAVFRRTDVLELTAHTPVGDVLPTRIELFQAQHDRSLFRVRLWQIESARLAGITTGAVEELLLLERTKLLDADEEFEPSEFAADGRQAALELAVAAFERVMRDAIGSGDPQRVIAGIRAAFEAVPRGAITLHEAQAMDDYATEEVRANARVIDTEDSWEAVKDEWIQECPNALTYLDPVSWRYYLAAHMVWMLRHPGDMSNSAASTIFSLESDTDPEGRRFGLLTAEQLNAVAAFLRHLRLHDVHDVDEALAGHWVQFDGTST